MKAVRSLALNHETMSSLQPNSFVTTFIYAIMKMKIEDPEVWTSLAGFVSKNYKLYDIRNLSNILYAFHRVSLLKPVILNFDDLFSELELPFIMKLDSGIPGISGDP